jgi:hypothetical protein
LKLQGKSLVDLIDVVEDKEEDEEIKSESEDDDNLFDPVRDRVWNRDIGKAKSTFKKKKNSLLQRNEFDFAKTINNTLFEEQSPSYTTAAFNPYNMQSKFINL